MQLIFFEDKKDIKYAQELLASRLEEQLNKRVPMKLAFRQGKGEKAELVKPLCNDELYWHYDIVSSSHDETKLRHWNAFGFERQANKTNKIIAEINSPVDDYDGHVAGGFAYDESQPERIYLLHSGHFSGTKQELFTKGYTGYFEEVQGPNGFREMIVIGLISDDDFYDRLVEFLKEVEHFKEDKQAYGNRRKRKPTSAAPSDYDPENTSFGDKDYDPKFSGMGSRKGSGSKQKIKYRHEDIIESLVKLLETQIPKSCRPINRRVEFDLAILNKNTDQLTQIYEIKPKSDSQSIYLGVGQLACYAESQSDAERILVAPKAVAPYLLRRVKKHGFTYLGFSENKGNFTFEKL